MSDNDLFDLDLVTVVAHDLKSPISAVRGNIELIAQAGSLNESQKHFYDRAMDGLERMETLVASLLEFAALEKDGDLDFSDCDLGMITRGSLDLVESLAEKRQISIVTEIDDDVDMISGDRRLLGQVLSNLLTNAIKYNHEGGRIWVTVANQPDFVRVDVQDNGVGIPEKDQPLVFDRFFRAANSAQTHSAGSGLGLAIVKAIVQKHQGYIWLKSRVGEGSTFSFTMPRKNRMTDSDDRIDEAVAHVGEGNDFRQRSYDEGSIEESDDIDDNTQESRDSNEIDSSNDVV